MTTRKSTQRDAVVVADWQGLGAPRVMGNLHIRQGRGSEVFSFAYDTAWLEQPPAVPLDPELQLFRGELFPSSRQAQFGLFLDSAPERWGRTLMRRREALQARQKARPERVLSESDYLLGVHDETRLGGLRFRDPQSSTYLASSARAASVPLWTSLRELEEACRRIDEDEWESGSYREALRLVLAPGSSLGGARPKASVRDHAGGLWIAKFPSRDDRRDSGAWEMLAHGLAARCGIAVAEAKLLKLGRPEHTFLVRRFDRDAESGERRHFVSAMTLLQRLDGDSAQDGVSYLELAELIQMQGAQPTADLEQLWRRIVFSMLVSNCDDHLRNHGFLLTAGGWTLSPAYDVNPDPDGNGLKLNVSENDNAQDLELALAVAPYFRVAAGLAASVVADMRAVVRSWDDQAAKLGIPPSQRAASARAFRLA